MSRISGLDVYKCKKFVDISGALRRKYVNFFVQMGLNEKSHTSVPEKDESICEAFGKKTYTSLCNLYLCYLVHSYVLNKGDSCSELIS